MSTSDGGLVAGYVLDGRGGGRRITWEEAQAWRPGSGTLWIHLDYSHPEASEWLIERSRLEPTISQAMIAEETRPRSVVSHGGLLVILRGANLNAGASPEDMVAIRVWLEADRIITTRQRRLRAVEAPRQALESGEGPSTPGDFLVQLADGLTNRVGAALTDLDDEVDQLEDEVLSAESYELRSKIAEFRRTAIQFRRYLAPQKDTILHLQNERVEWLTDVHRAHLREIADRTVRFVENLDSARDRAAVAQDELNGRLSEQMNKTMYVLSIVAGIFLPLGLLTGLLGINVGGMPGVENPWAFAIVCALLLVVGVFEFLFFRRKGWI